MRFHARERGARSLRTAIIAFHITRDLKITHPARLRRFSLKFNGIGRRGFNQQKKVAKIRLRLVGVASFYWPRQIMIVQRRAYQLQKRSASYCGDYSSSSQLELASKAISQPELRSPTLVIIVFLAKVDNVK